MRALILLVCLLTASPALAIGPEMLLSFMGHPSYLSTINGHYQINSTGTTDTGTALMTVSAPSTVSVIADCSGGFDDSAVMLEVNGTIVDSLSCDPGESLTATLSTSVSGNYSVRVYGEIYGDNAAFSADSFHIPGSVRQIYSDTFTGTNGTTLATHDSNWVSVDAGHLVSGLALYGDTARSAAGAWGGAIYNASSSDTSQLSVQPVSASVLKGPCVRAGGANGTGYCIDLGSKVGGNYTRLNLRKNGVLLTYATVAAPVSSAYTLRVEASGTSSVVIDCYMEGSLAISRTDSSSPLTGGHPGFIVESNGVIEDTALDSWQDY